MNKECKILSKPLKSNYCEGFVQHETCGAIVIFRGTVRNHNRNMEVMHLEFEAYHSMAVKEMQKIIDEAFEKWPLHAAIIHHRSGKVKIGEDAVIIAVSSVHRDAAYSANRYLIDSLKQTVPIWKKEIYKDGHKWISAHP